MELSIRDDGRVTIVSVTGDLVIGDAETAFKREILRLLEEGKVDILIDCSGLRFVDSTGLGALVRALTTSQGGGGQTKLLNVGPHLRKLLELTRLDSVFEKFDDPVKAISSF
jgi:anti-sigma B factor antagonist